jgi:hypothetical protein
MRYDWHRRLRLCPISGKNLAFTGPIIEYVVMPRLERSYPACPPRLVPQPVDAELVGRLAASTGLSAGEAARVAADVLAWYREPVDAYVRRRHARLQAHGMRNDEIFALIAAELAGRLVAAPDLSQRQLRRIVYG